MNACTRFSHSFCFSDKSKFMGRSSGSGLLNSLGRTVRPPLIRRKVFCAAQGGDGLTFPALQTIVSYNCLNCNATNGDQICRAIGPGLPSLPPPNGFTPIAVLAT